MSDLRRGRSSQGGGVHFFAFFVVGFPASPRAFPRSSPAGDAPLAARVSAASSNKAKDHRTKKGKWRIREKHLTTTMDGDGPAGDLPYSIQDVPYVQYYDGSYALHGAFWHHNFGREQSHGCVNLAPKDAKHIFMWTEPRIPRGWHGVWSSDKRKGTLVVVHE